MSRYIISLLFCVLFESVSAQLFRPLESGRQPMIRVSVDPTLYLRRYFQDADMVGFDVAVDTEIKQNLFIEAGMGVANLNLDDKFLDYKSNGMFLTLGANLNLTKYQTPQDRHIFYVGFHYGYAFMAHEATDIYYSNHWGTPDLFIPLENRTASWLGLAMGLKAEAAKNFFIGWSAESKLRTHLSSGAMKPYYIAGFGKTNNRVSLDFNIWLSYAFSFKPRKYEPLMDLSK